MGKDYKNKYIKVRKKQKDLQDLFEQVCNDYTNLNDDFLACSEEARYMHDFIHYKNLENEFRYFCENAHEEDSELPFPYLVI